MWRRWIFGPIKQWFIHPKQPTHLTEEEALRIGQSAGGKRLQMVFNRVTDGRVVWYVSEPGVGSIRTVKIDDETGKVISNNRSGIR